MYHLKLYVCVIGVEVKEENHWEGVLFVFEKSYTVF